MNNGCVNNENDINDLGDNKCNVDKTNCQEQSTKEKSNQAYLFTIALLFQNFKSFHRPKLSK